MLLLHVVDLDLVERPVRLGVLEHLPGWNVWTWIRTRSGSPTTSAESPSSQILPADRLEVEPVPRIRSSVQ